MDGQQKYHSCDLRRGRISVPGQIYHITLTTQHRQPYFANFASARAVVRVLRQAQQQGDAQTFAYVVMPDHLHWLMALGAGRNLSKVVGAIKSITAHQIGCVVWQQGFHDHALRHEERIVDVARYIVANPLRARLVARLGDYSHWDAAWL